MCGNADKPLFRALRLTAKRRLDTGEPVKPKPVVPRSKAYNPTRIVNPFTSVDSPEEFLFGPGVALDAPEGAENVYYNVSIMGFASAGFEFRGHEFLLRASRKNEDIMGIYGETVDERLIDAETNARLTSIAADGMLWHKLRWSRDWTYYTLGSTNGAPEEDVLEVYGLVKAERFLSLKKPETIITKVQKGSELASALLQYVKSFSWEVVKAHTVSVIENWEFADWETPFAAIADGRIVGMAAIMKTDYYPRPDIFPWVTTVFVSEEYRGRGICGRLIDHANRYAKALGFERTYIPTEIAGLYEKYGYRYVKDIVNYGGGTDRLYAKELN